MDLVRQQKITNSIRTFITEEAVRRNPNKAKVISDYVNIMTFEQCVGLCKKHNLVYVEELGIVGRERLYRLKQLIGKGLANFVRKYGLVMSSGTAAFGVGGVLAKRQNIAYKFGSKLGMTLKNKAEYLAIPLSIMALGFAGIISTLASAKILMTLDDCRSDCKGSKDTKKCMRNCRKKTYIRMVQEAKAAKTQCKTHKNSEKCERALNKVIDRYTIKIKHLK